VAGGVKLMLLLIVGAVDVVVGGSEKTFETVLLIVDVVSVVGSKVVNRV